MEVSLVVTPPARRLLGRQEANSPTLAMTVITENAVDDSIGVQASGCDKLLETRERPIRQIAAMGTTDNIPESSYATVNNELKRDNDVHVDLNWYT